MFYALRNLFALVGFLAVVIAIYAAVKITPMMQTFETFDEGAFDVYFEMMAKVLETGNSAEAMVWKVKVSEGLSADGVEETMRFVANEHNIKNVGELPLSGQIEAMTGKETRYLKIYMFCNALTAAQMLEYSDAYSAFLPCRVSMVEDKAGRLWLYSLNMDAMIYGGTPLPAELKEEAEGVKEIILDIMNRGAKGDF
jgi:uncharacterized protein (DUF302 family)